MNYARPNFDLLRSLTPLQRVHFLRDHLDALINLTPTGPEREALTEVNMRVMSEQDRLERLDPPPPELTRVTNSPEHCDCVECEGRHSHPQPQPENEHNG